MYSSRRVFIGASLSLAASAAVVWAAQQGAARRNCHRHFHRQNDRSCPVTRNAIVSC